jgi:hypothetical protein
MTRTLLLALHIAAIASWLGADVLQHALRRRWERESAEVAHAWARMQFFLHDRYYAVVAVVIALTGVGLVFESDWSWSSGFVWVGIGTVVLGGVLGGVVLKSLAKQEIAAWERGDPDAARAFQRRMLPVELLLTAAVLVAILAMVDKWAA